MELKISERKKKRMMRLRKWGIALIFISFFVFAIVTTALLKSPLDWVPIWIKIDFSFILAGGCIVTSFIFIFRAQRAKTQRVFIGQNLIYITYTSIKSEGSLGWGVIERQRHCVTVISRDCDVKVKGPIIKFYGGDSRLIKRKELGKQSNFDKYTENIIRQGFSDTIKSAEGKYFARESILRILEDSEEERLKCFFSPDHCTKSTRKTAEA